MRLGLALPHYDTSFGGAPATWAGVSEVARTAERAGFDSLWISDHLFLDWSKYGGSDEAQGSLECFTTLAALVPLTEHVRLGTLTLCNDLRNPGLVAKMVATIDVLSGGRTEVGFGAGWYEPEYKAAGIPFDRAGARIDRVAEAVQICGRLLEGEELTFEGEHYSIHGAVCKPGPLQDPRPRIWMGGKGDRLLSRTAKYADGWNFSWLGSFDVYRERARTADRLCESAGRDPATLHRSVGAYVLVGRDEADVRRRYERLVERTPPGVLTRSRGAARVSWDEFREGAVAGTVGDVADRLGRLAEVGVEEVIVGLGALPFQVADLEDVELVGTELAPAMR